MKLYSSLTIFLLIFTQIAFAASDCKTERTLSAAEQIATLDPSFDLDLVDLDIFPGGSIVGGYEYEVEPAHTDGLYERTDSWQVGFKLIPGIDLGDIISSRLNAGVQSKTEATFIRFFKDPCKAMLAKPYSLKRIPLKAKTALGSKFNIGDYFVFRGSLGFVASAEIFSMLGSSFWGVGLSGSYVVDGFYQVHVVRIDDKHLRLKIVAYRGKGYGAALGLGYENEFDIFSVDRLNSHLERFLNTKPVKLKANINNAKVFMVDYVLDLTDPEVVEAYENLLPKAKDFKNLGLLNPFKNVKDLEANLLLDLTALEEIYRKDFLAGQVNRLKRNLKSSSEQDSYGFGLDVGNKILGFKLSKGTSSANMSVPREDDFIERYLLKSWEGKFESRFLYSLSRTKDSEGLRALFHADETFEKLEPINIVKFINNKKNRFSYRNFKDLKLKMRKSLPTEIYNQIPWTEWNQRPGKKFLNYGLRYELMMAPESILKAPQLSEKEIVVLYRDHLLSKGLTADDFFANSPFNDDANVPVQTAENTFNLSLNHLAKLLSKALNPQYPASERIEMITKLRRNVLFDDTGISFIMALNPDKISSWYHLDLNISSNKAKIDFSYGDSELSTLYKKILTIKAALDDDGLDLRREAESISSPAQLYSQQ